MGKATKEKKTIHQPPMAPYHAIVDLASGVVAELAQLGQNNTLRVVTKFGGGFKLPQSFAAQPEHTLVMTAALRHPNMRPTVEQLADQLDFSPSTILNIVTAVGFRTTDTNQ
jgi:hypothetical protein